MKRRCHVDKLTLRAFPNRVKFYLDFPWGNFPNYPSKLSGTTVLFDFLGYAPVAFAC